MTDERHPDGVDGSATPSDGHLSPRGEELTSGELPDTEDYQVADDQAEELVNADTTVDDTPDKGDPGDVVIDDPAQLDEAEETARKARSSRPVRKKRAAGKADAALRDVEPATASARTADGLTSNTGNDEVHTPSRSLTQAPVRRKRPATDEDLEGRRKRTTPAMFVRQSVGELRKVRWPTGTETGQYFIVVLVFVLVIIGYVGGLDALFAKALLEFLG